MLNIREQESLKGKTTMRIGGSARFYADLTSKEDVEEAVRFATEQKVPLIVLGGGSNTIFADGTIDALVVRISASDVNNLESLVTNHQSLVVQSGKNLPQLINELAAEGLDLSPLTGILGTVGGAVFGNAGQGPTGVWIDRFVESVTFFHEGAWQIFDRNQSNFRYRESFFKDHSQSSQLIAHSSPIIWETTLTIPRNDPATIQTEIEKLLKRRIETQPHVKTAGSCFKAVGSTPAWQLIDAAGLRGAREGGVVISEKHANFLINDKDGTFEDAVKIVNDVKVKLKEPLSVEMRFVKNDATLEF